MAIRMISKLALAASFMVFTASAQDDSAGSDDGSVVFSTNSGCLGLTQDYSVNLVQDGCSAPCMQLSELGTGSYVSVNIADSTEGSITCYVWEDDGSNCTDSGSYTSYARVGVDQTDGCFPFPNIGSVQCYRGLC